MKSSFVDYVVNDLLGGIEGVRGGEIRFSLYNENVKMQK